MTAKIDRFEIRNDETYIDKDTVYIVDYLHFKHVAEFMTDDKKLNLRLAKLVYDELNREFEDG